MSLFHHDGGVRINALGSTHSGGDRIEATHLSATRYVRLVEDLLLEKVEGFPRNLSIDAIKRWCGALLLAQPFGPS